LNKKRETYPAPNSPNKSSLAVNGEVRTDDPSAVSDAQALVDKLENFEFIVGMVIWHDVLFSINMARKKVAI